MKAEFDPWADYYDLIHTGLPGEAEFYVGQAVRIGGSTLELGCGTGRIAIPMAMSGVDVVGLDNSRAMLACCLEKLEAIGEMPGSLRLIQGDMAAFELDARFDFIAMPYRTFMHLLTPVDQKRALTAVRRHLADDGVFIVNLWAATPSAIAPYIGLEEHEYRYAGKHAIPGTETALLDHCAASYDEFRQVFTEDHFLQELDADAEVVDSVELSLTRAWTTPREMQHLVELCGFAVEAVFGDFDCGPFTSESTEMIWVLRKGAG